MTVSALMLADVTPIFFESGNGLDVQSVNYVPRAGGSFVLLAQVWSVEDEYTLEESGKDRLLDVSFTFEESVLTGLVANGARSGDSILYNSETYYVESTSVSKGVVTCDCRRVVSLTKGVFATETIQDK